jgi:hypothetical protein
VEGGAVSFLSDFAKSAGVTVRVDTVAGGKTLALGESGPPGPLTRFLRPRVTVQVQGETVATIAPAGAPEEAWWAPFVIPTALVVGVVGLGAAVLAVKGALE